MIDAKKIPLKKLTPKLIMETQNPGFVFKPSEAVIYHFMVYGAADKTIVKPSQYDEGQNLLMGRFEAKRLMDGAIFEAANLYLPDKDTQNAIAAAMKSADGEVTPVEFAYMVGTIAGKSPTGYVWVVDALTDTKTQDALAGVRNLVSDQKLLARFNLAALAAPVAETPKTAAKK